MGLIVGALLTFAAVAIHAFTLAFILGSAITLVLILMRPGRRKP
jgi:hypothetical protein